MRLASLLWEHRAALRVRSLYQQQLRGLQAIVQAPAESPVFDQDDELTRGRRDNSRTLLGPAAPLEYLLLIARLELVDVLEDKSAFAIHRQVRPQPRAVAPEARLLERW